MIKQITISVQSYIADENNNLKFAWFESQPDVKLLGKVTLTLRPKCFFDEAASQDRWQFEK